MADTSETYWAYGVPAEYVDTPDADDDSYWAYGIPQEYINQYTNQVSPILFAAFIG